jgi:hypothetical protein
VKRTRTVSLTESEWSVVTAALLCLRDHDENRGASKSVAETKRVRELVRCQLYGTAGSRRQAGESLSAADLFAKGQQILKGGR